MNEHLHPHRLLALGLGDKATLAEQAHARVCDACRSAWDAEKELSECLSSFGHPALPTGFSARTAQRFETALAWRRLLVLSSLLVFACVPSGLLVWLMAIDLNELVRWIYDFNAATAAMGRALETLTKVLPLASAVLLASLAVTGILSAYLLAVLHRRPALVKYAANSRSTSVSSVGHG